MLLLKKETYQINDLNFNFKKANKEKQNKSKTRKNKGIIKNQTKINEIENAKQQRISMKTRSGK